MNNKIDKNYRTEELFTRWMTILRSKASYEHKENGKKGVEVSRPTIDDICNEMLAYLAGILI